MVNEQIQGTLDLIAKIESAISEDVQNVSLVARDDQGTVRDMSKTLRTRRRSTGNFSFGQIARLADGNLNTSMGDAMGEPNGEKSQSLTRLQQLENGSLPAHAFMNLLRRGQADNIDQTMMTEVQYLRFLQDSSGIMHDGINESSFFKSIVNVERSSSVTLNKADSQTKIEENQALTEVNEANSNKI